MNLTFKRGNKLELDNIEITPNMLFFTTDDNGIYMDDKDSRYKIFGLNDSDTINTLDNTSINTYLNKNNSYNLLTQNLVATNGNVTNKEAIGVGYYNNVIGENIEDVLYDAYPSITSSITYLQTAARSILYPIWINEDKQNTWTLDFPTVRPYTVSEDIDISIDETYLGYVLLMQSVLSQDNSVFPIVLFSLPSSISDEYYRRKISVTNNFSPLDSSYQDMIETELTFTFNNANNLNIHKYGRYIYSGGQTFLGAPYHDKFVPISLYGWRI